jgi:urease accessory protein
VTATDDSLGARLLALSTLLWPSVLLAHAGHGTMGAGGFLDGLVHPVTGLDHVVAMVAVGLWGAQLGAPAIWLLPITFPLVMALGAVAGLIGIPLPHAVAGVALSGVILGGLVAFAARPALWIAAIIVAAFAVFHGHTHGTALPLSGVPLAFGAGFVIATGLLHLCGITIGVLNRWRSGALAIRISGALIAVTGAVYLGRYVWERL